MSRQKGKKTGNDQELYKELAVRDEKRKICKTTKGRNRKAKDIENRRVVKDEYDKMSRAAYQ